MPNSIADYTMLGDGDGAGAGDGDGSGAGSGAGAARMEVVKQAIVMSSSFQ